MYHKRPVALSADNNSLMVELKHITALILDFDGVLTNNKVIVNQDGIESVLCSRSDGIGLARLRDLAINLAIISTEINPVVTTRAKKLNIDAIQGAEQKGEVLTRWAENNSVSLEGIAYVGNDINDIPAFSLVGLPIGVADSFTEVYPYIKYITSREGGNGAVREVCDLIYCAHTTDLSS